MPTKSMSITEAQHHLADLVAQAATGTEIILLDGQIPRARLVALPPRPPRRIAGLHRGAITLTDDFDAPLADAFWLGTA